VANEPPSISGGTIRFINGLSKDSQRAVDVVFQACKVTGASLVTCHRVAALVAEELEKIEAHHAE
jgi:hypothetical protein